MDAYEMQTDERDFCKQTTLTTDENIDILQRAKADLLENGWIQGSMGYGSTGPTCLMGSIYRAAGYNWDEVGYCKNSVMPIVFTIKDITSRGPAEFNDLEETTLENVLRVIDLTVAHFEKEGRQGE